MASLLLLWNSVCERTEQQEGRSPQLLLTVAISMEAVASSMMRMLLLRTNALARQKSWR